MLLKETYNFYVLPCGNNALKQETVHSSMACCLHVFLYNAAKYSLHVNALQLLYLRKGKYCPFIIGVPVMIRGKTRWHKLCLGVAGWLVLVCDHKVSLSPPSAAHNLMMTNSGSLG
jgi:hypothetical protein